MWHDGGGIGAGGWVVMAFMMVIFWSIVAAVFFWLVRAGRGQSGAPSARAREILDERFARGELTEEEYRQRRALLAGG